MNAIAEITVSHPDMALVPTISSVSDIEIQVIPHSATDPRTGMFFFLVEASDRDFSGFERALEQDHTVIDSELVSESEETRIYQFCHSDETKLLSPVVAEVGGLMLEAVSCRNGWSMRLQFSDRESITEIWEYCEREEITFDLRQLYRQDEWTIGGVTGLTEPQRVALLTAHEEGYFDEPRETSLEELAEELDISPTAVGGRIRRGTAKLIETTLTED